MNRPGSRPFDSRVRPLTWISAAGLALSACLCAQQQAVLGIVRDASGQAVAGAALRFFPRPSRTAPWHEPTNRSPVTGHTRHDGRFRLEVGVDRGCLVVDHPERGSRLTDIDSGVPSVIELVDPAFLRMRDGEPVRWRLRSNTLEPCRVGERRGREVRVAAGSYSLLLERDDRFTLHHVRVEPGAIIDLDFEIEGRTRTRLVVDGRSFGRISPAGFEDVTLLVRDGEALAPMTRHAGSVIERIEHGACTVSIEHNYDSTTAEQRVTSAFEVRTVTLPPMAIGAQVYSIAADGSSVAVKSRCVVDATRRARYVPTVSRASFLVVERAGFAPVILTQPIVGSPAFEFIPESRIQVRVQSPDGPLNSTARVSVLQSPLRALERSARTNLRGEASFGGLAPGYTLIRVDHPGYQPARAERMLETGDQRVTVELQPGFSLHGVVLRDGAPEADAIVELRSPDDPSGSRMAATDRAGRFRFTGLAERDYTVTAQLEVAGTTWSTQIDRVLPGEEVRLVLEHEDPPLPTGRDR